MKIKTNELTGLALDWAAAKCNDTLFDSQLYSYSTEWSHGGPILEREMIGVRPSYDEGWTGSLWHENETIFEEGPSPLIAGMRCFVASRLGDEVDVPDCLA